jgi:hypothetical protein
MAQWVVVVEKATGRAVSFGTVLRTLSEPLGVEMGE